MNTPTFAFRLPTDLRASIDADVKAGTFKDTTEAIVSVLRSHYDKAASPVASFNHPTGKADPSYDRKAGRSKSGRIFSNNFPAPPSLPITNIADEELAPCDGSSAPSASSQLPIVDKRRKQHGRKRRDRQAAR